MGILLLDCNVMCGIFNELTGLLYFLLSVLIRFNFKSFDLKLARRKEKSAVSVVFGKVC